MRPLEKWDELIEFIKRRIREVENNERNRKKKF